LPHLEQLVKRQAEEAQTLASIQSLKSSQPERLLDAARILELANKAYFLLS
jgi:hypothetical protein